MSDDRPQGWGQLLVLFKEAEAKLKDAERLDASLGFPGVNELRYAGYHVVRARAFELGCLNDPDASLNGELDKARRHCQRATYDAVEIQVMWYLESLQNAHKAHVEKGVADIVRTVLDSYVTDLTIADRAQDSLATVKLDHDNREKYYSEVEPHLAALKEIHRKWRYASPSIDAAIRRQQKKDLLTLAGLILASLGVLSGLLIALL